MEEYKDQNKQDIENSILERMEKLITARTLRLIPRPTLVFNVELTEHCNLNCKGCGSFAPLADEEFLDVDDYRRDAERLSALTGGMVHHIDLLGGEPLLHPRVLDFVRFTRRLFPVGIINLVTNGILLPSMSGDFWDVLRDNKITISVTRYPIKLDFDWIEKKSAEESVMFRYHGNGEQFWFHNKIKRYGNYNEIDNFIRCANANVCPVLEHGRLYPCARVAKVKHFNKYYGEDYPISERDYVDIYKTDSLDEILQFLARPIPFCRFCDIRGGEVTEWETSKRNIEEWT